MPSIDSSAGMLSLWSAHRHHLHNPSNFASGATIVYVPTGAGGNDSSSIQAFCNDNHFTPFNIEHAEYSVVSSTVQDSRIVQEWAIRFCQNHYIPWLLPGLIEPSHRQVSISMVFFVNYYEDRISSLRVYWDQASVLEQIGYFHHIQEASHLTIVRNLVQALPVIGSYSYERVINPLQNANPLTNKQKPVEEEELVHKSSNVHTSTRINSRQVGGEDNGIFSTEPLKHKPIIARDPRRHESHFTFDNSGGEDLRPTLGKKLDPKNNVSSIDFSEEFVPVEKSHVSGHARAQSAKYNESHVFDEGSAQERPPTKRGNRTNDSVVFGSDDNMEVAPSEPKAKPRPTGYFAASPEKRPSSRSECEICDDFRVLKPPGGGSTIHLG